MAEKLLMLALSPTMETGVIAKWNYKEGASIDSGDVLCEVETDKATMDYECSVDGTLLKILIPQGGKAGVGDPIAILGDAGEDVTALIKEAQADLKKEKPAAHQEKKESPPPVATTAPPQSGPTLAAPKPAVAMSAAPVDAGSIKASPLARKMAEDKGIPLGTIQGSGPEGRIVKADVEAAHAFGGGARSVTGGTALREERIHVSMKRQVIAQRLGASKFTAPHYYLKVTVRMDELMRARQDMNKKRNLKISMNAYMIKMVADTLTRHPFVNATWEGETILKHGHVDIALAVAQPDGLITPVVRHCETKGICRIDEELKVLIDKTRNNTLSPDEYTNSTFTISNLGSFGIEEFTAIINPPNSAILAVGEIKKVPVADETGHVSVQSNMKLSMSCDHRIIDGALGAAFLKDLKETMEYPIQSLL